MKLDFISKWDFNRFIERKQGAKRKCARLDGFARVDKKMLLIGLIFNQGSRFYLVRNLKCHLKLKHRIQLNPKLTFNQHVTPCYTLAFSSQHSLIRSLTDLIQQKF